MQRLTLIYVMHKAPQFGPVISMAWKDARESNSVIGDIQQAIKRIELPYADGLYDWQTDLMIQKTKDQENISSRSTKGISLRGFTERGWAYSNSNRTDNTTLRRLARTLKTSRAARGMENRLAVPDSIKLDEISPVKRKPWDIDLEEKLQRVRDIFKLTFGLDSRIVDVRVFYSEVVLERALVTQHGTEARQLIPRTRIFLQVIVKEKEVTDYDGIFLGGTAGFEVVDNLSEELMKNAVQSAVEQLKAIPPPKGLQQVILDPGVVGTVCHESFGHGLEADQAIRGRSYLKDMLGKKVASDIVTIYEDPSFREGHGSYFFDDDGVLARKNTLVENGTLVSFLHDMETAAAMNAQLTASSRTQNAAHRRFIRMSNTYAKPGHWSVDDMIKNTKRGTLMVHWQHGMEDPLGGGMQVVSKKGYLIENGVKTKPLRSVTLTGRVLEVLGSVDAISKEDFRVDSGNCGKGPEDFVPVGGGGTWWRTKAVIA